MIDPDYFGCSGKLSYRDTLRLAGSGKAVLEADYSIIETSPQIVTSIDRIHRCSKDFGSFARIALNHALGDIYCAFARPIAAMLSFEFGPDLSDRDRELCSEAFANELEVRGIKRGKCHSSISRDVTAVTVALIASARSEHHRQLNAGDIFLTRPIGTFKLHYLSELGVREKSDAVSNVLENLRPPSFPSLPSLMTDISGHGLAGAALFLSEAYGLSVTLNISRSHTASEEVLSTPVECLQNPIESYGEILKNVDLNAIAVSTLRETAGPYLILIDKDNPMTSSTHEYGIHIGTYTKGTSKLDLNWNS